MTTTIKRITGFHHTPQGLFLDYEDQPAAVAVHPGTGDILLDEGEGQDRYHGAAIPRSAHPRFTVTCAPTDPEAELKLEFGTQIHSLGRTEQTLQAVAWGQCANALINAVQSSSPIAKSLVLLLGGRESAIEAITRAADELETGEQSAAVAD